MMRAHQVPGFPPPRRGFWLFAYGSLMWRPEFKYAERRIALLEGYHRALCVYSWVYRGTEDNPGLVFGLDRGGMTKGMAFRIRCRDAKAVYEAVHAREMPTDVYRPVWAGCRLPGDRRGNVQALAYVADDRNAQYAGTLGDAETVRLIQQGEGQAGPCADYVRKTLRHLRDAGIRDLRLERVVRRLG